VVLFCGTRPIMIIITDKEQAEEHVPEVCGSKGFPRLRASRSEDATTLPPSFYGHCQIRHVDSYLYCTDDRGRASLRWLLFPAPPLPNPPSLTKTHFYEIQRMIIYTYDGTKRVWEDICELQERSSPPSTNAKARQQQEQQTKKL
jgi:hypothetical protein